MHMTFNSMNNYEEISRSELKVVLRSIGCFPRDRRGVLWRQALQLPLNYQAYSLLQTQSLHSISMKIKVDFNFLCPSELYNLIRLSSSLAHWFPFFVHMKHFPQVLKRLVELYKNCPVSTFEAAATILENYCQNWFKNFPLAPCMILDYLEKVIQKKDAILANHFLRLGCSASEICWFLLRHFFMQVLVKESWYRLWDHIIIQDYHFFLMVSLAFIILHRDTFMGFQEKNDLKRLHKPFKVNIHKLIQMAKNLADSNTPAISFKKFYSLSRKKMYDDSQLVHPDMVPEYEDLDVFRINDSEERTLYSELENIKFKEENYIHIISKGDLKFRKRRVKLLQGYYAGA